MSADSNLSIDQMARMTLQATDSNHLRIVYDTSKPSGQHRKDIDTTKFKNIFPNYKFTPYIEGVTKVYNTLKQQNG